MYRNNIIALLFMVPICTAQAGEHIWNFTNLDINLTKNGYIHSITAGSGMNVNISAWSSTGNGCLRVAGNTGMDDVDSCIESAKLKNYGKSGLGIQNRDEKNDTPNHAIDNTNDKVRGNRIVNNGNHDLDFDMVLFSFDHEVKLTGFASGWEWNDFDASIVAYTGSSSFTNFGKSNWSNILQYGWSFIDSDSENSIYGNQGARDFSVDDKSLYSKHWLVGTYNSAFDTESWTDNNDAFKINGLRVVKKHDDVDTGNSVNAPTTVLLLCSAMGWILYRKKMLINW